MEETGEPWIEATVTAIYREARGQYSDKPIRLALAKLEQLGFLTSYRMSAGTSKKYLLHSNIVQQALDGPVETTSVKLPRSDGGAVNLPEERRIFTEVEPCYKEEEKNRIPSISPLSILGPTSAAQTDEETSEPRRSESMDGSNGPSSARLMSDVGGSDTDYVSYPDFVKRWNWYPGRRWKKITNSKANEWAERKWESMQITDSGLDAALSRFANSEWGEKTEYALGAFLKGLENNPAPRSFPRHPIAPAVSNARETVSDDLSGMIEIIRNRHPQHQRCGRELLTNLLRAILARFPEAKRPEALAEINRKHEAWCNSDRWKANGGQYVPKLSNYMSLGSEDQWDNDPPLNQDEIDDREAGYYYEYKVVADERKEYIAAGGDATVFDFYWQIRKAHRGIWKPGWMEEEIGWLEWSKKHGDHCVWPWEGERPNYPDGVYLYDAFQTREEIEQYEIEHGLRQPA